jgi:hypothetical protein
VLAFARVSSKSGDSRADSGAGGLRIDGGGVGETSNSRH